MKMQALRAPRTLPLLQKVVSMFEAETFTARYFVRELSGFILQKPLFEVRVILMTFI